MDEAGDLAVAYLGAWNVVENPVVTEVKEIRFWKRVADNDDAPDFSHVLAYQVSGRFEWKIRGEYEGYNRFMFIVERESRRVRGFYIRAGAKLSVLSEGQEISEELR